MTVKSFSHLRSHSSAITNIICPCGCQCLPWTCIRSCSVWTLVHEVVCLSSLTQEGVSDITGCCCLYCSQFTLIKTPDSVFSVVQITLIWNTVFRNTCDTVHYLSLLKLWWKYWREKKKMFSRRYFVFSYFGLWSLRCCLFILRMY